MLMSDYNLWCYFLASEVEGREEEQGGGAERGVGGEWEGGYCQEYNLSNMIFMCLSDWPNSCKAWWTSVDTTWGHKCSNACRLLCVVRAEERRWEQKEAATASLICCAWRERKSHTQGWAQCFTVTCNIQKIRVAESQDRGWCNLTPRTGWCSW